MAGAFIKGYFTSRLPGMSNTTDVLMADLSLSPSASVGMRKPIGLATSAKLKGASIASVANSPTLRIS